MATGYNPIYFLNAISELDQDKYFIQGEFPLTRGKEEVLATAAFLDDPSFDKATVTSAQLEDLIFCLVFRPSALVIEILTERMTDRLLGLVWAFFQYHYNNENIIELLTQIEKNFTRSDFESKRGQIIFDSGFLVDPVSSVVMRVLTKQDKLRDLVERYQILPDSPFYNDLLAHLFMKAQADIFRENADYLLKLFSDVVPISAMIRYLDVLPPEGYIPEVNNFIVSKFGLPGESDFWLEFPPAVGQKVKDWAKIYRMSQSYPQDSKKYKFFAKYSSKIKDTQLDENSGILKILFGSFNIIDDLSDENQFIFCADPTASLAVTDTRRIIVQYSAKDYIVRGTQAEYLHISLSGLDKMYADELFDILLDM